MWHTELPWGSAATLDHRRCFLSVFQTRKVGLDHSSPFPASRGEGERLLWKLCTFVCLQQEQFQRLRGCSKIALTQREREALGEGVLGVLPKLEICGNQPGLGQFSFLGRKMKGQRAGWSERGTQGKEVLSTKADRVGASRFGLVQDMPINSLKAAKIGD